MRVMPAKPGHFFAGLLYHGVVNDQITGDGGFGLKTRKGRFQK